MVRDTGSPRADAESDFLRARRHNVLSSLAGWMRSDAAKESGQSLSFTEVVEALGRRGERNLGVQVIPLDSIVGSVDKVRDFDRRFRPTSDRSRQRWEQMALKSRQGHSFPPIDVYKLGNLYFVRDGHHRVSVARMHGADSLDANVTEIDTVMSTD
ncbi:MAG: chromosome partitioning protein ParB, partial [Marmoricola sp.]|nr:chromosome partitioning protein ParB [Marmoricola sp.]